MSWRVSEVLGSTVAASYAIIGFNECYQLVGYNVTVDHSTGRLRLLEAPIAINFVRLGAYMAGAWRPIALTGTGTSWAQWTDISKTKALIMSSARSSDGIPRLTSCSMWCTWACLFKTLLAWNHPSAAAASMNEWYGEGLWIAMHVHYVFN